RAGGVISVRARRHVGRLEARIGEHRRRAGAHELPREAEFGADQVVAAAGRGRAAGGGGGREVAAVEVALGGGAVVQRGTGGGAVAQQVDVAAPLAGGVAAEGAVDDGERAIAAEDRPAQTGAVAGATAALGEVAREGAVGDGHRAAVVKDRASQARTATTRAADITGASCPRASAKAGRASTPRP